ncbi:hypothetical protein [Paraburkholderia ribeironis]|uniref:hypothetical protein n=1 Tax=Paraburkholderia ribeironis TaxID=1247936 RepID=UPI001FEB7219|nr:hypothetical protein [Paraburkholderia ribeironis]
MVHSDLKNASLKLIKITMEQFFMRRASAVIFLLNRRHAWREKITAISCGNVEWETREIESIERLVLDVRAGRVHTFELAHPATVVIVTD